MKTYFGIDVSKEHLDFAGTGASKSKRVGNDKESIKRLVNEIGSASEPFAVVEATGGYPNAVVRALQQAAVDVAVANPRRARAFAGSLASNWAVLCANPARSSLPARS